MKRVSILSLCLLFLSAAPIWGEDPSSSSMTVWFEDFSRKVLDPKTWRIARSGDFKESKAAVINIAPAGQSPDHRLRLRADTLGTNDRTVKFLGVRRVQPMDFKEGIAVSVDLDWNNQTNGSYLTAAVYLCPTSTGKNPQDEADWIRFEYVGVPPGQNARATVATKVKGLVRWLYMEGWPDENRTGRKIGLQHLVLRIDTNGFSLLENETELYQTDAHGLGFNEAYLYLQMSSHSNYPAREVYFDHIAVRPP